MDQSNEILTYYLRVTQHMSRHFRTHFGKLNLTFPQALVLSVRGEEGPVPISTLAERTGSANSTISGVVDRLEKLGLAKRERSESDRRVIYVGVTEKYRELHMRTKTSVSGYFSSLLETMGEADQALVCDAMKKLSQALSEEKDGE